MRGGSRSRGIPARWVGVGTFAAFLLPCVGVALGGCNTRPSAPRVAAPASVASIPVIRPISAAARGAYLGSEKCVTCHQREAGQLQSHHARTLAPVTASAQATRFSSANTVTDSRLGLSYHTAVENDQCALVVGGRQRAKVAAQYALGSGHRAVTYVGQEDGHPLELRLTYYQRAGRWDFTPGDQVGTEVKSPAGRPLTPAQEADCFNCHATALVRESEQLRPEQSILGVGCEACHGPGAEHVEAVRRKDPDLHMARFSQLRTRISTELCGQCHRTQQAGDPGNALAASQLPRLQGAALALSACFKKSNGQLTCVTCHNPHRNAQRETNAQYNQICSSCHTPGAAEQVSCRVQPQGDCISCHMPLQEVLMPTNPRFRTHWIKLWPRELNHSSR